MQAAERERGERPGGLLRIVRRLWKRQLHGPGFPPPGGYQMIRLRATAEERERRRGRTRSLSFIPEAADSVRLAAGRVIRHDANRRG